MQLSHFTIDVVLIASVSAITVSPPSGIHGVASTNFEVVDNSRKDPYSTTGQTRRIMLSAFFPTGPHEKCKPYTTAYMPALTAAYHDELYTGFGLPNGTFEQLELSLCKPEAKRTTKSMHYPTVLFSPGLGNSRLLYSAMAQSLASHGFIVITIDHTADSSIVEFPNGGSVLATDISSDEQIEQAVDIRTQDLHYIVDQLQDKAFRKTMFGHTPVADLCGSNQRIIAAGHSLGGAAALSATISDSRITSAINLDGSIYGDATTKASHCPTLFVSHEGKNLTTDDSWGVSWPLLKGSKALATVQGSAHGSFTDLPLLASTLGLESGPDIEAMLGSIGSGRMLEILNSLVANIASFSAGRASLIVSKQANASSEVNVLEEELNGRCSLVTN